MCRLLQPLQTPPFSEQRLHAWVDQPPTCTIQLGRHGQVWQVHRPLFNVCAQSFLEACVAHVAKSTLAMFHEVKIVMRLGSMEVDNVRISTQVMVGLGVEVLAQHVRFQVLLKELVEQPLVHGAIAWELETFTVLGI